MRFRPVCTVAALAAAAVLVSATPAWAHAELRSTEPVDGQALAASPERVVLRFTEPVESAFAVVRVYDGSARRVDAGSPRHVGGDRRVLAVRLPDLTVGSYVVTWRVSSADAHTARGALTFRVGGASARADEGLARRLLAAEGASTGVGALTAGNRGLLFAGVVVFAGAAAFLWLIWPAGSTDRFARRLLWGAWIVVGVATVAGVALQGAAATGLPLGEALHPSRLWDGFDTRFGRLALVRLGLLATAVPVLAGRLGRRGTFVLTLLGAGALVTVALSGHAATGSLAAAAVVVDAVHLGAISLWLGGLAVLGASVLRIGTRDDVGRVARRFSGLALWSVVVVALTGVFQTWRQVGSLPALTETTYGRLLAAKVVLALVLVALGARSRAWVSRRSAAVAVSVGPGAAAAGESHTQLRRLVTGELVMAGAVLAAAALLASAVPARTAYGRPFSAELDARRLLIDLTIDPAKAGPVDVHVYTLDRNGQVAEVEDVEGDLRLDAPDVGPLRIPLRRAGRGHFAAYGFTIPLPGEWNVTLIADLGQAGSERVESTVRVR